MHPSYIFVPSKLEFDGQLRHYLYGHDAPLTHIARRSRVRCAVNGCLLQRPSSFPANPRQGPRLPFVCDILLHMGGSKLIRGDRIRKCSLCTWNFRKHYFQISILSAAAKTGRQTKRENSKICPTYCNDSVRRLFSEHTRLCTLHRVH